MKNLFFDFLLIILFFNITCIKFSLTNIRNNYSMCEGEYNCKECEKNENYKKCQNRVCYCCDLDNNCMTQKALSNFGITINDIRPE